MLGTDAFAKLPKKNKWLPQQLQIASMISCHHRYLLAVQHFKQPTAVVAAPASNVEREIEDDEILITTNSPKEDLNQQT